jgi:hypothetical protein
VRRAEALEAEHPLPARREVRRGGAAHATLPDDYDVVGHAAPSAAEAASCLGLTADRPGPNLPM